MITGNDLERIAELVDTVDNFLMLQGDHMPIPMRADSAKRGLKEIREALVDLHEGNGGDGLPPSPATFMDSP